MLCAGLGGTEHDSPVLIGQNAAVFTLTDTAGQTVSLNEFAGRPVVLSFFGNACAPCKAEAVHLSRFQDAYQSGGLVVLSINAWDEPAAAVSQFAKQNKLSHRILVQGASVARVKYRLGPVPTTFWIDRQGKIVHQTFGFNEKELGEMEAWIKKIVGS
jgi:peroxiredoxin